MAMIDKLEYLVVIEDGLDLEVLGRLKDLDLGFVVFTTAIANNPLRNIFLRQGARIVRRHDGQPKQMEPTDPNLLDWDVNLIRGSKNDFKGIVMARDEEQAKKVAIEQFKLIAWQIERLMITKRH
jgi:hypothetical protein